MKSDLVDIAGEIRRETERAFPDDQTMEEIAQHMEAEAAAYHELAGETDDPVLAALYRSRVSGFTKAAQMIREDANTAPNRG